MAILGIPDIVVREAVHVDLEPAIVVQVDVRNEKKCAESHPVHHPSNQEGLNLSWDIKVLQLTAPTNYFFIRKRNIHSFARHVRQNSRMYLFTSVALKPWPECIQTCHISIQKVPLTCQKNGEGQRDRDSKGQKSGSGRRRCQLRNHNAKARLGSPDIVVREAVHADPEPAIAVQVDVRNEKLAINLEEE